MKLVTLAVLALAGLSPAVAYAQSWKVPTPAERCPSKWGASDTRGSANHMKPESVLKAVRLIKTGEVIEIGQVLSAAMPFFGTRRFDVHTKRTFMNDGSNRRGSNEELVVGEMGQVGTQFDGFTHQTHEDTPLQLHQARRDRDAQRLHQDGDRKGRLAHHARRADRRRGAQGRRDAARRLRDHARRPAAGARAAEAHAPAWRRGPHPHRLEQAVGERQRALREELPGHRHRGGDVARQAGSDARRRRQLASRGRAQPGHAALAARCISSCSSSAASTCSRT